MFEISYCVRCCNENILLSGGRDKQGQSLISFPARNKQDSLDRSEIRRTVQYLASIPTYVAQSSSHSCSKAYSPLTSLPPSPHSLPSFPLFSCLSREDVREYGFSIVLDARTTKWDSVKLILRTLQEALPGQVHVVYTVQSPQYIQKRKLGKEKGKLEFTVRVLY